MSGEKLRLQEVSVLEARGCADLIDLQLFRLIDLIPVLNGDERGYQLNLLELTHYDGRGDENYLN